MSLDSWRELATMLSRNKLRTFLTGLSVAWGIFMLVILLAAGKGLQNGVEYDFRDDATNSLWIMPGKTAIPYAGLAPGRKVRLENADLDAVKREVHGVEYITGRFYLWGDIPVSYKGKTAHFDLRGCHPDHKYLERTIMLEGRFINDRDIQERRKVAVIGPDIKKTLFGTTNPIGEMIEVRGINYKVVGLYEDEGSQAELKKIYVPITTAQLVYHGGSALHHMMFTMGDASLQQAEQISQQTRKLLGTRHRFAPEDKRALSINNNLAQFKKVREIFDWIRVFVWVVGIGTILAGVIGVSNIMLISVRERTVEFGIRKAIGATPWSVIRMVLQEALIITSLAGYVGLVCGALVVEFVRTQVPENDYIRDPQVDFAIGIGATLILVAAGMLAGLMPALKAASIKPIVAIRNG